MSKKTMICEMCGKEAPARRNAKICGDTRCADTLVRRTENERSTSEYLTAYRDLMSLTWDEYSQGDEELRLMGIRILMENNKC